MKNQNGITLIALVITIIVLLILAGVAIAMLSGDNGILKNAREASVDSAISGAKEQIAVKLNEEITDFYAKKYAGETDATVEGKKTVVEVVNTVLSASYNFDGVTYDYDPASGAVEDDPATGDVNEAAPAKDATVTITSTADSTQKTVGTINGETGLVTWLDSF